jgi:hypothetical protein
MIKDQELEQLVRTELKQVMPNMIWRDDNGDYEVFGRYKIVPQRPGYEVWVFATRVGVFNSTKTALSWCIADKYHSFNLARQLLNIDNYLGNLNNDIFIRAAVANRTKKAQLREDIETKLEPKIIRKKELEQQLAKYVSLAKYLQQRGFNNETARSSRTTKNQTNR